MGEERAQLENAKPERSVMGRVGIWLSGALFWAAIQGFAYLDGQSDRYFSSDIPATFYFVGIAGLTLLVFYLRYRLYWFLYVLSVAAPLVVKLVLGDEVDHHFISIAPASYSSAAVLLLSIFAFVMRRLSPNRERGPKSRKRARAFGRIVLYFPGWLIHAFALVVGGFVVVGFANGLGVYSRNEFDAIFLLTFLLSIIGLVWASFRAARQGLLARFYLFSLLLAQLVAMFFLGLE